MSSVIRRGRPDSPELALFLIRDPLIALPLTERNGRRDTKRFADERVHVREVCTIAEGGETSVADDGVDLLLRLAEYLRVLDHGEEEVGDS